MIRKLPLLGLGSLLLGAPVPSQGTELDAPYPFERFVGEWTLKDDTFRQIWDGETVETLSIPGHHTKCGKVNTDMTILCEVDAVDFQGHILWAYDAEDDAITHLSHFGTSRLGRGSGTLGPDGSVTLIIRFTDEPEGTFRVYTYSWVSDHEYEMISTQHEEDGTPTGNWYGGTFVRVESAVE